MCCFIYFDQNFTRAFRQGKQAVASKYGKMALSSLVKKLVVLDKKKTEEEVYIAPFPVSEST